MPQWIDLDWSNFCNLKCVMCDASRSSTWAKETGEYADTKYIRQTPQQHIDEVYKLSSTNLRYLNLQGGEPSMMKEYDDYLQYLIDIGASKNCEVTVVTNLTNINKQFYKRLEQFKLIKLGVSIDSYGPANDFIRYPSKFDILLRNMLWIKDTPLQVAVSIAFQVASMFNLDSFLVWLYDMQHLFKLEGKTLDIQLQLVTSPSALNIQHAPAKLKQRCIEQINQYLKSNKRLKSAAVLELRLLHILKELQKPHMTSKPFVEYVSKIAETRNLKIEDYFLDWADIQD
jgi:sulfatase maturation enzyme AslB (radical SAM superfamily)